MKEFNVSAFDCFDKGWAVLSAGNMDDYNCMTISWGSLGTLWRRPVVTVYVRPSRYTWEYMEKNEFFTVSFFDGRCREDLTTLGTLSGREGDKVSKTSLTPEPVFTAGVTFKEAGRSLICRTIYRQELDRDSMCKEILEGFNIMEEPHYMYIGEVMDIIEH